MGRRKRRVVKIPKKKLPQIFVCPKCGKESVKIAIAPGVTNATVQCGSCGLKEQLTITRVDQPVDIYCRFIDKFYGE